MWNHRSPFVMFLPEHCTIQLRFKFWCLLLWKIVYFSPLNFNLIRDQHSLHTNFRERAQFLSGAHSLSVVASAVMLRRSSLKLRKLHNVTFARENAFYFTVLVCLFTKTRSFAFSIDTWNWGNTPGSLSSKSCKQKIAFGIKTPRIYRSFLKRWIFEGWT